jgi:DNA repair and recombination protein RAD52
MENVKISTTGFALCGQNEGCRQMTFSKDQIALLTAKLAPNVVKPAKSLGPKGDYIEGWHAMAEANRIFGFDSWSYVIDDTRVVAQAERTIGKDKKPGWGVSYVARVRVYVGDITRHDVGAGHGYDADLGLAHESAIKEAVTDALKRALRSFGNPFGLALYDKTRENVGYDATPPEPVSPAIDRILNMISRATDAVELGKWMSSSKILDVMAPMNADDLSRISDAQTAKLASFEREAS